MLVLGEKQYCMINGTAEHRSLEFFRFITASGEGEGVGEIMKRSVAIANLKLTLIMSNLKQVFRILFGITDNTARD